MSCLGKLLGKDIDVSASFSTAIIVKLNATAMIIETGLKNNVLPTNLCCFNSKIITSKCN